MNTPMSTTDEIDKDYPSDPKRLDMIDMIIKNPEIDQKKFCNEINLSITMLYEFSRCESDTNFHSLIRTIQGMTYIIVAHGSFGLMRCEKDLDDTSKEQGMIEILIQKMKREYIIPNFSAAKRLLMQSALAVSTESGSTAELAIAG